ncbi:SNF2 helicase associated domain-containing protein [Lactococcus ileimucosae]|uniref:SNF2 helicase associated domain-containing protein n=1 Tax=Lactococcus ileimucosae TaxID=2941329 RepID=UPI0035174829
MSRMMPARVRSEGIALYGQGLLIDPSIEDFKLSVDVDGEQVIYDMDGAQDYCSCAEFQRNHRYCKHIAAVEEYLKNEAKENKEDKKNLEKIELVANDDLAANASFLDALNGETQVSFGADQFSLEVYVEDSAQLYDVFSMDYFMYFDLRLYSERLGRAYVIKDIPYFLRTLQNFGQYSLGALHYVDLFFDNFDEASQDFLSFLLKIHGKLDTQIANQLYIKNGRYLSFPYLFIEEAMDLASNLSRFSLRIFGSLLNYFTFASLDKNSEIFKFSVTSQRDFIELKIEDHAFSSFYSGSLLYYNNVFYKVNHEQKRLLQLVQKELEGEKHNQFSYTDKDKVAQALQQLSTLGQISAPENFVIRPFRPIFYFSNPEGQTLELSVRFDYGNFQVSHFHELETLEFSRDLRLENKIFTLMARFGFARSFTGSVTLSAQFAETFFINILPQFQKLGDVELSPALKAMRVDEVPEIVIDRRGSLLDIAFEMPSIGENEFADVIAQLQNNAEYYVSEKGKLFIFDQKFSQLKSALRELDDNFTISGTSLEVNVTRSFQVSKIFENISSSSFSAEFKAFYNHLTHPETYPYEKPEHVKAELRSYQETGVRWMSMLTHYHLGGILADDMGLGKTVQAITYLLSNLKEGEIALVTAPASLVYNWASEFEQFTDKMDYVVVDGMKAEREAMIQGKHQIYITSYGSFLKDFDDYQNKELTYLLLDEAQAVKNYSSKTNRALSQLNVAHTFALSGTPLENRLEEIWAIFQVIMPGFLPKREIFNKMSPEVIARIIHPFIMRRKKEDVLTELPDKMEMTLRNNMVEEQKLIYLAQLELMQRSVRQMDSASLKKSRIEILAGITRLRQICNTPALFMENYKGGSGKLDSLMELLEQIKGSGHRPLIFSQFTKTFPYIEEAMEKLNLTAYKLTGSTPVKERLEMVQAFNAGSRDAFLISLKAGGVGLNLTSADLVILVDLWWNPAVEEQAIARAHRMGQKSTVEVIRLITQGTIEEKIMEIQERKKGLIANVLDGDVIDKTLSEAEIREILGL